MYSIFISHSAVSWEAWVATRLAKAGSVSWEACTQVPTGKAATDFSGGISTGV